MVRSLLFQNGKPDEYNFWPDIISVLRLIFSPAAFSDHNGYFFPSMVKDTAKFIKPCSKKIVEWIKTLKAGQQKIFLLTNSFIDYTNVLMNFAVGENWTELFDVIVCMAGKPGFFQSEEPRNKFYEIDGEKEAGVAEELKESGIFSRGNHKDFMEFLKKEIKKDKPKVLYFGDSLRSDLASAMYSDWHVITVLEEMESEGIVVQHSAEPEEQNDLFDDGPKLKKPRHLIHDHIEIEKSKEEVLLSNQWGSFFWHNTEQTGDAEDSSHCINNVMDGFFVCEKASKRRQINTFWGELIEKYSTIAIPRIDFITELPLDYPFEPFSSSSGGFFPGSPKSLHL
ncbi:5'-nucleotidase domain-containing protein 1-like [Montipora foliosa]|uniref:5'-nucleotidase domain-containing protein 1-like n=1 Tax=Montipora foliosa TaxID=591990 RepID=UPI0035F19B85